MSSVTIFYFLIVQLYVVLSSPPGLFNNPRKVRTIFDEQCPEATSRDLPEELIHDGRNPQVTQVKITIMMLRFVEISDIQQRLSLYFGTVLDWGLPCNVDKFCEALKRENIFNASYNCPSDFVDFYLNYKLQDVWIPKLMHKNAFTDSFDIMKLVIGDSMLAPFIPSNLIYSEGRVDSSCSEFSFAKFPWDELRCSITFAPSESAAVANYKFGEVYFENFDKFMSESEIWQVDNSLTTSYETTGDAYNNTVQYLSFSLHFKRKYFYFLCNILIPVYALSLLQIAALLIPPDLTDRASYSITVVLASSVILGMVSNIIPATSDVVYLVVLVLTKLVLGVAITLYSLIVCSTAEWLGKRTITKWRIGYMKFLDSVMFIFVILATIISDAIFFAKMVSPQ